MTSSIKLDKWVGSVTVTHMLDVCHVYVGHDEDTDKMIDTVAQAAEHLVPVSRNEVCKGLEVITRFTEDECFYRARVEEIINDEDKVRVLYYDFGNGELVSIHDLWKMPDDLKCLPPVAVLVLIDGAQGIEDTDHNRKEVEKKIFIEGLKVKISKSDDGSFTARFAVNDKKIKFQSSKSKERSNDNSRRSSTEFQPAEAPQEIVRSVEIPKSSTNVSKFQDLPSMKLLPSVEISGQVVHVSAMGSVWFTPTWIEASLNSLCTKIDELSSELKSVQLEDVSENLLCIAKNGSDGCLYRARVVEQLENSVCLVKYIDYGDSEKLLVTNLFHVPPGLEMMAPAAAEIVLARKPPVSDCQVKLEETLMERDLVLVLEEEETGVKVGKFFENGNEIRWDDLIDPKTVYDKGSRSVEDDDVIVETPQEEIQPPEEKSVQEIPQPKPEVKVASNTLYKVVPAEKQPEDELIPVYLGYVESSSKVWICREEDEEKVTDIMNSLASLTDLVITTKFRIGAVFGCRFSQDNEMYRAAIVGKEANKQVKVQFIDFGNFELKSQEELFCIPKELASKASSAFCVNIKSNLEDNEENREQIEALLSQDDLKVKINSGIGTFFVMEVPVIFKEDDNDAKEAIATGLDHLSTTIEKIQPLPTVIEEPEPTESCAENTGTPTITAPSGSPSPAEESSDTQAIPSASAKTAAISAKCFTKAIHDIKSQQSEEKSAPRSRKGSQSEKSNNEIPWSVGEVVNVKCDDGVWRCSTVVKINNQMVLLSGDQSPTPYWVESTCIRSACLPADALNMIDKDINYNVVDVKQENTTTEEVDLSVAVGVSKVQEWIKNQTNENVTKFPQDKSPSKKYSTNLPTGPELIEYCKTNNGSHHIQSVLTNKDREFSSNMLQVLMKSPNPMLLLTGTSSCYVIQKLVSVLPSSDLAPLHNIIASNFIRLSLDKTGCRLVQYYLEYSSQDQRLLIANQLCCPSTLKAIACDSNGAYVAQACLSPLFESPDHRQSLVQSLLSCIVKIGKHPSGTYFMQAVVFMMSKLSPSASHHLLYEEVMTNIGTLAMTEPGSRFIQKLVKCCPDGILLRIMKWVIESIEEVVEAKSAVFVALAAMESVIEASNNDLTWLHVMEKLTLTMLKKMGHNKLPLIVYIALHDGNSHLLAKEVVASLNVVSEEVKSEVLICLGAHVKDLRFNKNGCNVLKALETVIN